MRPRRFERKPPAGLGEIVDSDDGIDPRLQKREPRPSAANRKALQLAAQVERTLVQVFAGECGDEVLRELRVETVVPAPDSGHLLVTLSPAEDAHPLEVVLEHLHRASGRLRSEVAAAIHRRKAPELHFRVTSRQAGGA
ncbi:MAG TPA: ribosome-binding factor A [Gemmataceae bacterium]|jgi:ribosome-binding factor A|nr:ribosome-binding factor A [Gemmataceae bacterium]